MSVESETVEDAAPSGPAAVAPVDRGLLLRYRVLAFTTATLLIILVFVGIPLQVAAHRPAVVNDVGTVHGFLYLVYLFFAFQLTRRLATPKWQMGLVLLAGTVPFAAFFAERKMTHRFDAASAVAPAAVAAVPPEAAATPARPSVPPLPGVRRRWVSSRAFTLHVEVVVVAGGCLAAFWWQLTSALAGNSLSWVYTIEWPIFAAVAVGAWWLLVHEDPEAYRARKQRHGQDGAPRRVARSEWQSKVTFESTNARLATVLAALVGLELALGIVALVFVPLGRPSDVVPGKGAPVYVAHATVGLALAFGAALLLVRVAQASRISRLSGWIGASGIALASLGGLATVAPPVRIAGMIAMALGTVVAGFAYLFPLFERLSRAAAAAEA